MSQLSAFNSLQFIPALGYLAPFSLAKQFEFHCWAKYTAVDTKDTAIQKNITA